LLDLLFRDINSLTNASSLGKLDLLNDTSDSFPSR
jgi:hypothetical protein